ncbi:MAG: SDR family oxidoreductase [Alphaproteobacteria bacterium]
MSRQMKKVLVTGHQGYIGRVLVEMMVAGGYDVAGLDCGYFAAQRLVPVTAAIPETIKDIRDIGPEDVAGFDAIIHLAALSNDPLGNVNARWTAEINHQASVALARLARQAGVARFLFSSSCIMYGMSEMAVVNEDSPQDPQTEYARSKVASEREIRALAGDGFSPVYLRNGTIYGVSPCMRFDTVLNSLVGSAVTGGRVVVLGDGKPWRPVTHVEDVCRYFLHVLEAPVAAIHNQAFNCGADHLNYEIRSLAEFAAAAVPGATVDIRNGPEADRRTYKVDFTRFRTTFPDFAFKWDAKRGAEDLYRAFVGIGLTAETFSGDDFIRLKSLKRLTAEGRLDDTLRWRDGRRP